MSDDNKDNQGKTFFSSAKDKLAETYEDFKDWVTRSNQDKSNAAANLSDNTLPINDTEALAEDNNAQSSSENDSKPKVIELKPNDTSFEENTDADNQNIDEENDELTLQDILDQAEESTAAGGNEGGSGSELPDAIDFGQKGQVASIARDLGIGNPISSNIRQDLIIDFDNPVQNTIPLATSDISNAQGLEFVVYESALATGSAPGALPIRLSGNILANDSLGNQPTTITDLSIQGFTTIKAGPIWTINTGVGLFTLYVQNVNGKLAGDFTYELYNNDNHPKGQDANRVLESFSYTITDSDGDSSQAEVIIKIVDDVPVAQDDGVENLVEGSALIVGNVLDNDTLGADRPGQIVKFTYDNGTTIGTLGETITTSIGGQFTLQSDGAYTYLPPANVDNSSGAVKEQFNYTLIDSDGDESSANIIINITDGPGPNPNDDGLDINDTLYNVYEGGLASGSGLDQDNPNAPDARLTTTVSGNILANDDLGSDGATITSVAFNGQNFTSDANGMIRITTSAGTLTLYTQNFAGHIAGDFTYTLQNATLHADAQGPNLNLNDFVYTLTDIEGDSASATLRINIVDDVPQAINEVERSLTEGQNTIFGNVLNNDIQSADGPTVVTRFFYDNGLLSAQAGQTVTTHLGGKLTVNIDGSWTYLSPQSVDNSTQVNDNFRYEISDADNDISTAEQRILITDGPGPNPNDDVLDVNGEILQVFEAGLAKGSAQDQNNPNAPDHSKTTSVTGNVLVNDELGSDPASITQVKFNGQIFIPDTNGIINVNTPSGTLTLYTQNFANHAVGDFSYELTANADHPAGAGNNALFENFEYTLTDLDGDKGTSTIKIQIVDDVPIAFNDTVITSEANTTQSISLTKSISFDNLAKGAIISEQYLNALGVKITTKNSAGGPDKGILFDTTAHHTPDPDLEGPWSGGNIKGENLKNILIIADNIKDSNNDNLVDNPNDQAGSPAGMFTLDFNHAINSFGFDMVDIENGIEINKSSITFKDSLGAIVTIPLASFINPNSPYYDPSIELGDNHANRISPILAENLGLEDFVQIKIEVGGSGGFDNFTWSESANYTGPSKTLTGNVLDNDVLGSDDQPEIISFTYLNHNNQLSIGSVGVTVITQLGGEFTLNKDGSYTYQTPLNGVSQNSIDSFKYTFIDSDGDTASAALSINIENIVPEANNDVASVQENPEALNYNLIFVLDNSGSMGEVIGKNSQGINYTRLDKLKEALTGQDNLLDSYAKSGGDLKITIINFNSSAAISKEFSNVNEAKAYINALKATGQTNYEAAINLAKQEIAADAANNQLVNYNDKLYFISDGKPYPLNNALDNQDISQWQSSLANNNIDSIVVNIAPNSSDVNTYLEPIANPSDSPLVIEVSSDLSNLTNLLLDTIPNNEVTGNVLDNDVAGGNPPIEVISFTYNNGIDAHAVGQLGQQVTTANGGKFTLHSDGSYTYIAPNQNVLNDIDEMFQYTIKDLDGDQASATLTVTVKDDNPLANKDISYFEQPKNYNLAFGIDVSGSMAESVNGQTRLDITKAALVLLLQNYAAVAGEANVTLIPFASASGANNNGAFAYHATSIDDAINYIQNTITIGMENPNTGQHLATGTQYNDALFHARQSFTADLSHSTLANYEHRFYFLSDGSPNSGHSATNTNNWPTNWGPWQDYVDSQGINVFPISIATTDISQSFEPVGNAGDDVLNVKPDLSNLNEILLSTIDNIHYNALDNDVIGADNAFITEITFEAPNAQAFINDNDLGRLNAIADANGTTIRIPVPADGSTIEFTTLLKGELSINKFGDYHYTASSDESIMDVSEEFTYKLSETGNPADFDTATITVNIIHDPNALDNLLGDENNNALSALGKDGIVIMQGNGGDDNFIIDASLDSKTDVVVIKDFGDNNSSSLTFVNATDNNHDNHLSMLDVVQSVHQDQSNANVTLILNNGTSVILENIGTLVSNDVQVLEDHLHQIAANVNVTL